MKATQGSQSPEEVDNIPACKDSKSEEDLDYYISETFRMENSQTNLREFCQKN